MLIASLLTSAAIGALAYFVVGSFIALVWFSLTIRAMERRRVGADLSVRRDGMA